MRRPQFTLKTMLWLMAVVAAFCAGIDAGHQRAGEDAKLQALLWLRKRPTIPPQAYQSSFYESAEMMELPADSPLPIGAKVFGPLLSGIALVGSLLAVRSFRRCRTGTQE